MCKVGSVHGRCHARWLPDVIPSRLGRTCHDVLHHGDEVGRLAEGGRVVILILERNDKDCRSQGGNRGWSAVPGGH